MTGADQQGTASAADDPRLAAALEECLARLEGGLPPDRDALRARYPDLAEELLACLDGLEFVHRSAPPDLRPPGVATDPGPAGRLGDFRLIREVGRGGMGVVYEAEQVSLGRRVALKVLPFAAALDPGQLRRFQNEARAAALLHHPHIVPVYGSGCERGVYYYAMQFVDGPSLAAVIRGRRDAAGLSAEGDCPAGEPRPTDAHPTRRRGSTRRSASRERPVVADVFREAARLGAEAAEALEAAHQAGVIHRDVKPANLLLDAAGGLWVADFGLARFRSEGSLTRTGNLLGTLRYMSPEQALGRPGLVDHRTDVYALGATLYELLTLRAAFPEGDRERLLRQIDRDEPPRPRAVDPAVPAPMEAVVQKAMAKHPADRYGSAAELAADLRRFLGGLPVAARPPSWAGRCRRWVARHSGAVATAGTVAVVLLGVLSAAAVVVARQRDDAEAGRRQARRAVDEMYTEVAERWLARQPHLEPVQREFLEKARRFYDDFARDAAADLSARLEAARARRRVGDIHRRLGSLAEAAAAYADARHLLDDLAPGRREDPGVREEFALLGTGRGSLFRATGRFAEAEGEFRTALACYEGLAAAAGERHYALGRAGCEVNLGTALAAAGRSEEAGRAYGRALASLEALSAADPADAVSLYDLAVCLSDAGNLVAATRPAEGEAMLRRALAAEDRLLAAEPGRAAYRHARASTLGGLAALLTGTGRCAEARAAAGQALGIRARLAADFPHTPAFREEEAAARLALGDALAASGRPGEAGPCYRAAAVGYGRLAEAFPAAPEYRRGAAETLTRSADLLANAGRPRAAEELYRAALSRLAGVRAEGRPVRQDVARAWTGLGNALATGGRYGDAGAAYASAVAAWRELAAEPLADDLDRWGLAAALNDRGAPLQAAGRYADAEATYREAVALNDRLAAVRPGVPTYRLSLAAAVANRGGLLLRTGRAPEAEPDLRRAHGLAAALAAGHPDVPDHRRVLAACLVRVGELPGGTQEAVLRQAVALGRTLVSGPAPTPADRRALAEALDRLAALLDRSGRKDVAAVSWHESLTLRERLVADYPEVTAHRQELAWFLATRRADVPGDAARALAHARSAVAAAPEDADNWLALGACAFRAGAPAEARETLQRFAGLRGDPELGGFFLALARWRLGERDAARADFDRAAAWTGRNTPGDYRLDDLRREVASLLGRDDGR